MKIRKQVIRFVFILTRPTGPGVLVPTMLELSEGQGRTHRRPETLVSRRSSHAFFRRSHVDRQPLLLASVESSEDAKVAKLWRTCSGLPQIVAAVASSGSRHLHIEPAVVEYLPLG